MDRWIDVQSVQKLLTSWPQDLVTSRPPDLETSWPQDLLTLRLSDLETSWPKDFLTLRPPDLKTSWTWYLLTSRPPDLDLTPGVMETYLDLWRPLRPMTMKPLSFETYEDFDRIYRSFWPCWWKSFMEIANFWQKDASWRKIKEKRPHLKFNFTTRTSSIYLSRPFLKLGNGINLILVQHLHISTF